MTLDELNTLPPAQAREALLACCGSERWADAIIVQRPFSSPQVLHDEAASVWNSLRTEDWLEAFSKHPKIGESSSSKWSAQEQQGMSQANADLEEQIRKQNTAYERKFGWIFIICATGKSASEMLTALETRLSNGTQTELGIAAAEQAKIMHLRLDKLLAQ